MRVVLLVSVLLLLAAPAAALSPGTFSVRFEEASADHANGEVEVTVDMTGIAVLQAVPPLAQGFVRVTAPQPCWPPGICPQIQDVQELPFTVPAVGLWQAHVDGFVYPAHLAFAECYTLDIYIFAQSGSHTDTWQGARPVCP